MVTEPLIERITPVLRSHRVVRAGLFGSVARGTAGPASDVDLLVEFAPGASLLDLATLELDLAALLGRPVEVVTYGSLDARMRERVLSEQVPLL
jgi:predicted nucleotidyltransferase